MSRLVVRELNVEEYRGIRRLASPLKLAGFNVLVGRNNTGKTSILEALYLLNHPRSSDAIVRDSLRNVLSGLHSGFDSLVYGYHGVARITYKLGGDEVKVELEHTGRACLKFNGQDLSVNGYREILARNYGEHLIFAAYIPDSTSIYEQLRVMLGNRSTWKYLVKHGLHQKLVEDLVVPAVFDRFTEVLVEEGSLKLRKEVGEGIGPLYVDVRDLGEGVERVLLAALTISYAGPKLVLWDDVEVALHPALAEVLLGWLANLDAQVVLSTHSIDVLYALLKAYPRDAQVVLLKKTEEDVVHYEALSLDELEELVEKHVDPRRLAETLEL